MAKQRLTDEELDRQLVEARAAGRAREEVEPRAVAVRYESEGRRVVVDLKNGATFAAPVALFQGIGEASDEDLADVELTPGGRGVRWPRLDWDFGVFAMLTGIFGSQAWMRHVRAEIGRKAGTAKSPAKAAAAKANGARGGRPPKPDSELSPRQLARRRAAARQLAERVPESRAGE